ncbi:Maleylacetate reductase [Neolecta irregularis DAH-3]|uniref:Maleylacetate reductase n=1 Tax=Neolecta irregularis (strain DAH-3) TaxID=1198029 RepID=A0A1U7LKK0_NEOID|nr:Maleylacetate reductase [Neolecta irregularis DAH-3]|eukprot:OLL23177.1 Maleylacetate reductase [Neolecta irregularis DAH-3]
MTELHGSYHPTQLQFLAYGPGCLFQLPAVLEKLECSGTKAFIITGKSLRDKTPVILHIEELLGIHHAGTFSEISQHSPMSHIRRAVKFVNESKADFLISVGGGSPIDSTKAISYEIHKSSGKWLPHIAIPTTLSAAEYTQQAGFTNEEGNKTGVADPHIIPRAVILDARLTTFTPETLWLSSGIRALDHAVELLYHPQASEYPSKQLALRAIADLFEYLPKSKKDCDDIDARQHLQLAAFGSLFPFLFTGGIGLSHNLGRALGATYSIGHGICSCLTLSAVVRYKSKNLPEASQISRILGPLGFTPTGSPEKDALIIAEKIDELIETLGLKTNLKEQNIPGGEAQVIAERAGHEGKQEIIKLVEGLY